MPRHRAARLRGSRTRRATAQPAEGLSDDRPLPIFAILLALAGGILLLALVVTVLILLT